MSKFLKQVAFHFNKLYENNFHQVQIIFPNQRSIIFFNYYLRQIIAKPAFSPECTTINALFKKLSSLREADEITLITELYSIYEKKRSKPETFDDFYDWGQVIVNDFDDIDKYYANAKDIFANVKSLKDIDQKFNYLTKEQAEVIAKFWKNIKPENLSKQKDYFIQLWEILHPLYQDFSKTLREKNIAYEGMIFKDVIDKISNNQLNTEHKTYIFIGFNALNECEKRLMHFFKKKNQAEFYWDYDNFFLNSEINEASFFIKENMRIFPSLLKLDDEEVFNHDEKKIKIINISSDIGQTKLLRHELENIRSEDLNLPDKTAIVLADETLLLPCLNALPEYLSELNITMGFPLAESPVYSLMELLLNAQENAKKTKEGRVYFFYKDVFGLLEHQYLNDFADVQLQKLKKEFIEKNKTYISTEQFNPFEFWKLVFTIPENSNELMRKVQKIFEWIIKSKKNQDEKDLKEEFIYHLYLKINTLASQIKENKLVLSDRIFIKLVKKICKKITIPFEGHPLKGLQIMGLMESRSLDFDHLIFLSMNEGKLPKTESTFSFIPPNLRYGFGLPTLNHQDSIFAYYFYRLIKRAKTISFIYNSNQEGMNTGERSRFLSQLKFETSYHMDDLAIAYNIQSNEAVKISIEKDKAVQEKLNEYFNGDKNLSPSALTTYISCPLKFYFNYIAKIKENKEITEEIEANTFGSIFHDAMKELYAPYLGKEITKTILTELLADKEKISMCIDRAIDHSEFNDSKSSRFNSRIEIIREVLKKYILRTIQIDLKYAPFELISLEEKYSAKLSFELKELRKTVSLGGIIDRIDRKNKSIRIIDYKTGSIKTNAFSFNDINELFDPKPEILRKEIFQTMLYAFVYDQNTSHTETIVPKIYPIRKLFNNEPVGNIKYKKVMLDDYKQCSDDYLDKLKSVLRELFHPEMPFTRTENLSLCAYCPYNKICLRN